MTVRSPVSANASANGRPTWPQPPTTATSRANGRIGVMVFVLGCFSQETLVCGWDAGFLIPVNNVAAGTKHRGLVPGELLELFGWKPGGQQRATAFCRRRIDQLGVHGLQVTHHVSLPA